MITLVCGDQEWEVSLERAAAILKVQKAIGGSWALPDNYTLRDGIIVRADTVAGRGKASKKRDSGRDLASQQASLPHGDDTSEGES